MNRIVFLLVFTALLLPGCIPTSPTDNLNMGAPNGNIAANDNVAANDNTPADPPFDDSTLPVRMRPRDNDHYYPGTADNPNLVIVFIDFQCPNCRRFVQDEFPAIREALIDTGRVRWIVRHLPLTEFHAQAFDAALASECVGETNFFAYHDLLFENTNALERADLVDYAAELGVDESAFTSCLESQEAADRVDQNLLDAAILGVTATPTFFVNGQKLVGVQDVGAFEDLLPQ